jgi:hypothetical protein
MQYCQYGKHPYITRSYSPSPNLKSAACPTWCAGSSAAGWDIASAKGLKLWKRSKTCASALAAAPAIRMELDWITALTRNANRMSYGLFQKEIEVVKNRKTNCEVMLDSCLAIITSHFKVSKVVRGRCQWLQGQCDSNGCSFTHLALQADFAAMRFHNALHD